MDLTNIEIYDRPSRWVILRFTDGEKSLDRLMMGWYGGYAGSDVWKLNSGIEEIHETEDAFIVKGYSGKVYECFKTRHGLTGLMGSVMSGWKANPSTPQFEIVKSYEDICEAFFQKVQKKQAEEDA